MSLLVVARGDRARAERECACVRVRLLPGSNNVGRIVRDAPNYDSKGCSLSTRRVVACAASPAWAVWLLAVVFDQVCNFERTRRLTHYLDGGCCGSSNGVENIRSARHKLWGGADEKGGSIFSILGRSRLCTQLFCSNASGGSPFLSSSSPTHQPHIADDLYI